MSLEGSPTGGDRPGDGRGALHSLAGNGNLAERREAVHSVLSLQNQAADSHELGHIDFHSPLWIVHRTNAHQGLLRSVLFL